MGVRGEGWLGYQIGWIWVQIYKVTVGVGRDLSEWGVIRGSWW